MAVAVAHSNQPVLDVQPALNSVASNSNAAEIAAGVAQIMTLLQGLANKCEQHGIDPMTMLMSVMPGAAASNALGQPHAGSIHVASDVPKDEQIIANSRTFIEALDRGDVPVIAAALAPTFVNFAGGAALDRDAMLVMLVQRAPHTPSIAERTWQDAVVVRKEDVYICVAKAREVQAGNATKGGYLQDGWYFVQWVRTGDAWRVQMLTWQKELTESDRFNDIFLKGRGFSREPNRLLVEIVKEETPGVALELAMGQGRNAIYLASQGWNVTGVDGSEEGLRVAREVAAERDVVLDTVHADIDEWDFGENRFDLVTLLYAGDHARWVHKIKACLRSGGIVVVEGWARVAPDSEIGFADGQLANLFDGYEILRDETVRDVPDWAWDAGKLVRFVARKK